MNEKVWDEKDKEKTRFKRGMMVTPLSQLLPELGIVHCFFQ